MEKKSQSAPEKFGLLLSGGRGSSRKMTALMEACEKKGIS